ncbi:MAG: hypothetical protein SOW78_09230 [Clostridia bacterium]|nr:hypothetical protein [Clostridia bacterium]
MKEKIYYFNKGTKTLHIKGFCKNSNPYEKIGYYTEQEAFKDNGRFIHMCGECEKEKEKIILNEVKGRIVE